MSARNWVFTLNNPTDDELLRISNARIENESDIGYLVFGRETGESGTFHLQGYIQLESRKTMAWVKRLVTGDRAHLEVARGTPQEADDYCKKDGDYESYGAIRVGQGRRSDLESVASTVKSGASLSAIAEAHPSAFIRYSSGITKLRLLSAVPQREIPPRLYCFWGRTGVGKTRRVYEFISRDALYVHPGDRWFDGYDAQSAVLFDDFDGSWFPITYLLKLIDRYTFQVPIKGGYTWWNPNHIYFTSNHPPEQWYSNASVQHQDALLRRFREFGTITEVN
jgi:hypothetical protein